MELIIDKNGKAVDLEDVSVTIVYESKEEADRMKEGMASGKVQQLEWHPIEVRDGKVIGDIPEVGQDVILTLDNGYVTVDTFPDDYESDGFFWGVLAWAAAQPYEEKEGET